MSSEGRTHSLPHTPRTALNLTGSDDALQVLVDPKASELKRADHKHAIQRELDAVRKLQGALNVAAFEEAYEDRDNVYIVTELCRGGELWHRIGEKHYSERTVSGTSPLFLQNSDMIARKRIVNTGSPRHRTDLQAGVSSCLMTARVRMQVASYMRAVLRTLAQCHSHHILHRDIKPGGCTPQLPPASALERPPHPGATDHETCC